MTVQATRLDDDEGARQASDERRDAAVRDLLRLQAANRRLRERLAVNAATSEESLRRLLDGADPGLVLEGVDVAGARVALAEALAEFERARHQARCTFVAAQFDGGLNMKEIGRRWGISRQLAHRFFREARREG